MVLNHTFHTRLEYVNSAINNLLPNSGSTIQIRIIRLYKERQRYICLVLQDSLSSTHISYDCWTSPNALGIFGIVGHFADKEGRIQALLQASVEVEGAYTEEQLAANMFKILNKYDIKYRPGYFVIDNATANNRIVTSI